MAPPPRKRKAPGQAAPRRGGKRSRRTAATDDTERVQTAAYQEEHASAGNSYLSTRPDPLEARTVPPLTTLALKRVVDGFGKMLPLPPSQTTWESDLDAAEAIQRLPPSLSTKLLLALLKAKPTPISVEHVTELFLHVDTSFLSLPPELRLPQQILGQLSKAPNLRKLDLRGHASFNRSRDLAAALKNLPLLEEVVFAGCVKLDDSVVVAVSQASEDRLRAANLNLTAVTTKGIVSLLARCKNLEVLKLGSVSGLTDQHISSLVDKATDAAAGWRHVPLSRLKTLKLKGTLIGDVGLGRLLALCAPTLERLDISYTQVQKLDVLQLALFGAGLSNEGPLPSSSPVSTSASAPTMSPLFESQLTKLNVSGLPLAVEKRTKAHPHGHDTLIAFLSAVASQLPHVRNRLRTLRLGAIGVTTAHRLSGIIALTPERLEACLPHLVKLRGLRRMSLCKNFGINTGWSDSSRQKSRDVMRRFFGLVGRRCEWLEMGECFNVDRHSIDGVVDYHDDPLYDSENEADEEGRPLPAPRLQTLILDRTSVSDAAAAPIATCTDLRQLFVRDTTVSSHGLAQIMRGCPRLNVLDVTSCRGVPLAIRRDWFRAWETGDVKEDLCVVALP